mmetsp:Transcript_6462/g.16078  ORF Transcript_6462/g.16078 Transcript_6462/m.16078 type:complete len:295 (-) Transcript_6462:176-1060(-)
MPRVRALPAQCAEPIHQVGLVRLPERIVFTLQVEPIWTPLSRDIHVTLEGQLDWQLQRLQVTLLEFRTLQHAIHFRTRPDTLAARLQWFLSQNTRELQDHVLSDLVANVTPQIDVRARRIHLVSHDHVLWNLQHLLAWRALVACDRQSDVREVALALGGAHGGERAHGLLIIDHRRKEALPKPPLAIELFRKRCVLCHLPAPHDEKLVQANFWLMECLALPAPPDVTTLAEDQNLLAVLPRCSKGPDSTTAEVHLPQPRRGILFAEGCEAEVAQLPLRGRLPANIQLRDRRASD